MLIYFGIALLGLLLLIVTLVVGEIDDVLDFGADGDGVGPFNGKVLAASLTAFGSAGMLATYYDRSPVTGALIAAAAALAVGALAWWLIGLFYKQQATTEFSMSWTRGRLAEVTTAIPEGGLGQVLYRDATGSRQLLARSREGASIPAGQLVRIVDVVGTAVIVEPAGEAEPATRASGAERVAPERGEAGDRGQRADG
ncbi:NfeD family protein [Thermomicrobiaceae bacterium CFH 74404]|uniref:NfeD family protein n=1 Tax=Thermalbibacter longus TaxID=2951981 RepID=A0AA41WCH4_9BACT|nr:NfeD family protein [Thermalbibacter longus]MCM8750327.1 NfeD family protein [Thermalbibacter longus]